MGGYFVAIGISPWQFSSTALSTFNWMPTFWMAFRVGSLLGQCIPLKPRQPFCCRFVTSFQFSVFSFVLLRLCFAFLLLLFCLCVRFTCRKKRQWAKALTVLTDCQYHSLGPKNTERNICSPFYNKFEAYWIITDQFNY